MNLFQTKKSIYSLKVVCKVGILTYLRDMVKIANDYPLLPDKQLNPNAEFDTQKIIEAMILVVMPKSKVTLKLYKPVQVGMCIIDLSKVLMYEFHNDFIKTNIVATQDFHSLIMIV